MDKLPDCWLQGEQEIGGIKLNSCEFVILLRMERRYILGAIDADELDCFYVAFEEYLEASKAVRL